MTADTALERGCTRRRWWIRGVQGTLTSLCLVVLAFTGFVACGGLVVPTEETKFFDALEESAPCEELRELFDNAAVDADPAFEEANGLRLRERGC